MNHQPSSPDQKLLQRWNALLDGELDAKESSDLRALVGAEEFLASMSAFNTALKQSATSDVPSRAPESLKGKLFELIDAEQAVNAVSKDTGNISLRLGTQAKILKMPVWRAAVAALILVSMSIAGTLVVANGLGGQHSDGRGGLMELSMIGAEFLQDIGTHNQSDVKKLLVRHNMGETAPTAGSANGCRLEPINVRVGKTADGLEYRAIAYCTGMVEAADGGKALRRCVLFIVKGRTLPGDWESESNGMVHHASYGCQLLGRYNAQTNETYLVYVPGADMRRAEEMASPLIDF